MDGSIEEESGTLDRRRLLKGAAAVGVGAAAWTVPSMTSLGGTPAYAATCTGVVVKFKVGRRNTSCSCESGTKKFVSYKELQPACGIEDVRLPLPAGWTVILTHNGNSATPLGDSGECAPGSDPQGGSTTNGDAYATVGANALGYTCRIEVRVVEKNCGGIGAPLATVLSAGSVGPAGGSVAMPLVECAAGSGWGGDIFVDVGLRCSKDEDCLYV